MNYDANLTFNPPVFLLVPAMCTSPICYLTHNRVGYARVSLICFFLVTLHSRYSHCISTKQWVSLSLLYNVLYFLWSCILNIFNLTRTSARVVVGRSYLIRRAIEKAWYNIWFYNVCPHKFVEPKTIHQRPLLYWSMVISCYILRSVVKCIKYIIQWEWSQIMNMFQLPFNTISCHNNVIFNVPDAPACN